MAPRGGSRKEPPRGVQISKSLSLVLRHSAEKEGIKIDSQGYANVGELLLWRRLKAQKVTFSEILDAVSSSDKQRFGLLYVPPSKADKDTHPTATQEAATEDTEQDGGATKMDNPTTEALAANDPDPYNYRIRARQGHSIKTIESTSLLKPLSLAPDSTVPLPETVVHGTYHASWPKILETGGLKCMSRNHIHFASGPPLSTVLPDGINGRVVGDSLRSKGGPGGVISGMRGDAQILIYIDLKRALEAGCPFWISENGVILSEGKEVEGKAERVVGTEFFDVVVELKNGVGVLWENGTEAKRTPDWMLNAKPPAGKGGKGPGGRKGGRQSGPRLQVEKETDVVDFP